MAGCPGLSWREEGLRGYGATSSFVFLSFFVLFCLFGSGIFSDGGKRMTALAGPGVDGNGATDVRNFARFSLPFSSSPRRRMRDSLSVNTILLYLLAGGKG